MFDPNETIRATRAVAVRDLARTARALIDQVELNGDVFVLTRYGRMVALLAPIPDRAFIGIENVDASGEERSDATRKTGRARRERAQPEPIQPDPDWLELDSIKRAILVEVLENHPMPFSLNPLAQRHGVEAMSIAITRLENDDYIERSMRGNRLTPKGVEAARWLARSDASAPS